MLKNLDQNLGYMLFCTSLDCLSCKYAFNMEILRNCMDSFEWICIYKVLPIYESCMNGFVHEES